MVRFEAYGHAPYPPDEPILFVFRESSERAESHLLSLAAGVLSRHAHRAEALALLEAKLGPFHEPERWDGQPIPLTHGRATLVRIGQVYALYALSSASMDNEGEGEDNSFTLALDDVIRGIRPYAVITGTVEPDLSIGKAYGCPTEGVPEDPCDFGMQRTTT